MTGKAILLGIAILSLCPVWRDPLWNGGVNAFQALWLFATEEQKEHIPVAEAIKEAREAYRKYR